MSKRLAILAATTALAAVAFPVAAQDAYEAVSDEAQAGVSWDVDGADQVGAWNDDDAGSYEYESRAVVQDTHGEADSAVDAEHGAWRDGPPPGYRTARRAMPSHRDSPHNSGRGARHDARSQAPRLAYGAAERDEWLAQCRALHAPQQAVTYYEEEEDGDGGLLGGIIGAVVGGFAGNRIADNDRLLGTVIGAGVGGLAGAVIGSVVDDSNDRDDRVAFVEDDYGFDYCAAYLQNYERGYGVPTQVAYAPVMMVPVAEGPHRAEVRTRYRVIEEDVEVDARQARPARRHIRRPAPQVEQGKLTPAS